MLEFCFGLAIGLVLLVTRHWYVQSRLRSLLRLLQVDAVPPAFHLVSGLQSAIVQLQQAARRSQMTLADWQHILDYAPIAYIQVDQDNQLRWWNRAAQRLLNLGSSPTPKPRLLLELIRSYDLDRLIEETRQHQQSQHQEWVLNLVGADPVNPSPQAPLHLLGHSLPLPDGEVGVFLQDRQEVVTLRQQRDRWVADVAHELKTPLTSIRLVAETVLHRVEPKLQTWMERLLNEVMHLTQLVQDLLELGQLDQGARSALNLAPTDLVDLIYAAWETLEPLTRRRKIHLTYFGPDQLWVKVDSSRFYRVILNLLDNAIKYSPAEKDVQVILRESPEIEASHPDLEEGTSTGTSIEPKLLEDDRPSADQIPGQIPNQVPSQISGQVYLDIIDSGPGFPETALPHLFERFYRVDPARQRLSHPSPQNPLGPSGSPTSSSTLPNPESGDAPFSRDLETYSSGCGLGLAIVQQIVTAHHGTVQARNHPETGGAWLQVCLPLKR